MDVNLVYSFVDFFMFLFLKLIGLECMVEKLVFKFFDLLEVFKCIILVKFFYVLGICEVGEVIVFNLVLYFCMLESIR